MKQTYDKLTVISLDSWQHSRTCGYWYVVQNQHSAHTAFRTIEGLQKWAKERGLTLPELPAERGVHSFHFMPGSYSDHMHGNVEEFEALRGSDCIKLSNGQYTRGIITDKNGHKTVHYLSPNCSRFEYDYFKAQALVDAA